MKVLEEKDSQIYSDFMDDTACTIFKESMKSVVTLNKNGTDPLNLVDEIAVAMGQVVLDDIIERTKNMDRDTLIKWFAEVCIADLTATMVNHSEYQLKIMLKASIL